DCPSLTDYLKRFELSGNILQSKDAIEYVTKSLVKRLYNLGYFYAEIRYAPLLHLRNGLTQKEVVEAALKGLNDGLKECPGMEAGLILCTMRHADEQTNLDTVEVANLFKGTRVVAVDLAGDETLHPCSYYKNVFNKAKEYDLNITIHGGEATGSDEVLMAVDNGATRIGHGVHLSLDKETVKIIKDKNICFEFCPTSNLQTKSLKTYQDVPLKQFMSLGIPVTINSDNMTVSDTTAIREMSIMKKTFNLTKEEVNQLLTNSIEHAFTSESVKKALKEKLAKRIDEFYESL
nr:adenosine deaminase [Bacilli bacterium]